MDFSYSQAFGETSGPAYETLLLDVMIGDQTLFTRSDGVEATWHVVDPITAAWEQSSASTRLPNYAAGEWGPVEADALIREAGAEWRMP